MEHKQITAKNGTVHYWITGHAEDCVLFTHGATMDHGLFQHQIEPFAARYRVITWDVPAHGLSRPYAGFSLPHAARDLVAILDAENISQTHLVGQSMGGYISQFAACDHPDRVASLVMVGSSPLQSSYYSALDNWLLSITPPMLKLYPYQALIKTIASQIALATAAQAYALETLQGYTKNEIASIMHAVYRGVQAYQAETALPMPLLITYGDNDRTGKVQTYCTQWAARENRPLIVIPAAAHNANMDNPAAFNRILADFLSAPAVPTASTGQTTI